jgi:large subunit ribosomal protein L32
MPVPKQKKGRMRVHSRRAQHDKVGAPSLSECPQCHAMKLAHRVCPECGYYAGREVIEQK